MTRIRDALTTRGHAFAAAGLTLVGGGYLLRLTDLTRVGLLLVALPLLAVMTVRRLTTGVVVTRTVHPTGVMVDQGARVEVVIANTSNRRTRLKLAEERLHHRLGDRPRFVLPPMEPGDVRKIDYLIRPQVRGRYQLGPLVLRTRDPYGLANTSISLPGFTNVLVLPRIETLGRARPRGEGVRAEGAIPHIISQHGEDDVSVRSYRDGDDLRHIHWPATAHRAQLMVRQEDRPARRRAVIVLDSRATGHQGSETAGSFEWAVTAAASVAAHLSERRYALHLVSGETAADDLASRSVELDSALASLAVAGLGEVEHFDEVLCAAQPLTSAGGLVIAIVTDHDEEALRRVAALRHQGGVGLLFLLESAAFAGRRPEVTTDRTLALAQMLAATGWSTCVVGPAMSVAQAWNVVSTRTPVIVGA